jgi:hypothetical protein
VGEKLNKNGPLGLFGKLRWMSLDRLMVARAGTEPASQFSNGALAP